MSQVQERPDYDPEIQAIVDYVLEPPEFSAEAWETARYCLMDSLGCAMLALAYPACTKHLPPMVTDMVVPDGARVPGTGIVAEPVKAAWNIGAMVRWLDYNDTWLAAEWGHPSDNLGAILAVADFVSRQRLRRHQAPLTMVDVLESMIMAHEIQGILALENSFNRVGLDHVVLVKVASTAVAARLMGASREQLLSAVSHAWVDGQSLRTYRHAPNAGSRKSWAAGDASARAVQLADIGLRGEMGIPGALSAPQWGFYDVLFSHTNVDQQTKPKADQRFRLPQDFGCYVMEHILFKLSFPAEFHAQTACEAAVTLHPKVAPRLSEVERIELTTHESAIRIIAKEGPLANPADRDHCLQYMVAVPLLTGQLQADQYEDSYHAGHPEIDELRAKMVVTENPQFSADYLAPDIRSIANSVQVFFKDGTATDKVTVEFPIGHRRRRAEGIPVLLDKFRRAVQTRFPAGQSKQLHSLFDRDDFQTIAVDDFMAEWVIAEET